MVNKPTTETELKAYIDLVLGVCSSRAAYVINFILENGSITSEHIRNEGYVHGARAVGDVRDNGVPLITNKTKSSDNRSIAEYVFGSAKDIKRNKFGGRVNFPSKLKRQLIERDGLVCAVSKQDLPDKELQIDHKIPFYVSGDIKGDRDPDDFMLLSKSMQRAKSWDCEHCKNLLDLFDIEFCRTCYWASPNKYTHVAMKKMRSVNVTWEGEETQEYDQIERDSETVGLSIQEYIKLIIREKLN